MNMLGSLFRKKARSMAAVAAVAVFVLVAAMGRSGPISSLRAYSIRILSPVADAGEYVAGYLIGVPQWEVRELEDDRRRLTGAEARALATQKENEALRRLLDLKKDIALPAVSVRVLAYTHILGGESLLIDAGANQGIGAGDIAIDENRLLVGRVSEVTDTAAKVSVASNAGVVFSAGLVPLGGKVLAKGIGGRGFALELIPYDTPLRNGDLAVLAPENRRGESAIFVGRVVKGAGTAAGAFKTARAVLLSDPEALEHLLVLIDR